VRNKLILSRLLVLAVMLVPLWARAMPRGGGPEPWAEEVQLTAEQVQILKTLQGQFRQELVQIHHKVMVKRMELRTLASETFKEEKGEELRRQIQALRIQARERTLAYQKEALAVLTPEQQKKISPECELGFRCWVWPSQKGKGRGLGRMQPRPLPTPDPGNDRP